MQHHSKPAIDAKNNDLDVFAAIVNTCPAFLISRQLTAAQMENRHQAVRALPCALWIVAQAHQGKLGSLPAREAQHVVAAIDQQQPLIPELATFLRTTKAVIRTSRNWPAKAVLDIRNWRTACRFMHCLGVLGPLPHALDGRWELLRRALPIVEASAHRFNLTRRELFNEIESVWRNTDIPPEGIDSEMWEGTRSETWHGISLRHFLRSLKPYDASTRQALARNCIPMAFAPQPHLPASPMTLSCGWTATELLYGSDIAEEARQMRHCVARYSAKVFAGWMQLFSLRSANGQERVTVSFSPPPGCAEDDESVIVQIAGPDNDPVRQSALRALLELLQHLGPPDLRVSFF